MKALLRKKSTPDDRGKATTKVKSKKSLDGGGGSAAASDSVPPVFARFATSTNAASIAKTNLVSGPVALAPKARRSSHDVSRAPPAPAASDPRRSSSRLAGPSLDSGYASPPSPSSHRPTAPRASSSTRFSRAPPVTTPVVQPRNRPSLDSGLGSRPSESSLAQSGNRPSLDAYDPWTSVPLSSLAHTPLFPPSGPATSSRTSLSSSVPAKNHELANGFDEDKYSPMPKINGAASRSKPSMRSVNGDGRSGHTTSVYSDPRAPSPPSLTVEEASASWLYTPIVSPTARKPIQIPQPSPEPAIRPSPASSRHSIGPAHHLSTQTLQSQPRSTQRLVTRRPPPEQEPSPSPLSSSAEQHRQQAQGVPAVHQQRQAIPSSSGPAQGYPPALQNHLERQQQQQQDQPSQDAQQQQNKPRSLRRVSHTRTPSLTHVISTLSVQTAAQAQAVAADHSASPTKMVSSAIPSPAAASAVAASARNRASMDGMSGGRALPAVPRDAHDQQRARSQILLRPAGAAAPALEAPTVSGLSQSASQTGRLDPDANTSTSTDTATAAGKEREKDREQELEFKMRKWRSVTQMPVSVPVVQAPNGQPQAQAQRRSSQFQLLQQQREREREAAEVRSRKAEEQVRRAAEERAQREADERAQREAEEQTRRKAEERARREAQEQARVRQLQAQREAEERARLEAEEQARLEAEERALQEAQEQARVHQEQTRLRQKQARLQSEESARQERAQFEARTQLMSPPLQTYDLPHSRTSPSPSSSPSRSKQLRQSASLSQQFQTQHITQSQQVHRHYDPPPSQQAQFAGAMPERGRPRIFAAMEDEVPEEHKTPRHVRGAAGESEGESDDGTVLTAPLATPQDERDARDDYGRAFGVIPGQENGWGITDSGHLQGEDSSNEMRRPPANFEYGYPTPPMSIGHGTPASVGSLQVDTAASHRPMSTASHGQGTRRPASVGQPPSPASARPPPQRRAAPSPDTVFAPPSPAVSSQHHHLGSPITLRNSFTPAAGATSSADEGPSSASASSTALGSANRRRSSRHRGDVQQAPAGRGRLGKEGEIMGEARSSLAVSQNWEDNAGPAQHLGPRPWSGEETLSVRSRDQASIRSRSPATMSQMDRAESITDVEEGPPPIYPIMNHLTDAVLLSGLLAYLTFAEWVVLLLMCKDVRRMIGGKRELREEVLERFLGTIGYRRWKVDPNSEFYGPDTAQEKGKKVRDPLTLYLEDLTNYMRGVSTPTYQYPLAASAYLQAPREPTNRTSNLLNRFAMRAYTRVVLRLRLQAEREEAESRALAQANIVVSPLSQPLTDMTPPSAYGRSGSRAVSRSSSRAPSPSFFQPASTHTRSPSAGAPARPSLGAMAGRESFKSPLYRLRRAPLLRVYVPSPDGDWLSDASVLECEEELKRAGIMGHLRVGDVVWDAAVGDEGNMGRLIWDGNFLIDLDYTFSMAGDVPKYLHCLSFPPSYFHRVIRSSGNPICYVDLSPWGEEIACNLQLLQDRIRTETPQGGYHMVVRWVHRSSFTVRPRAYRGPAHMAPTIRQRIPIPNTDLFVDPGWYGTIVVEAEGTNEGLADLQARSGKSAFHALAGGTGRSSAVGGILRVFRVLRGKSRPGEIWIRVVGETDPMT